MQSIREFIIELQQPLNETFKTEGGIELYGDKDFSVDRLSNRIAKVISTPLFHKTEIKAGYEVMIEPTILYRQIYQGVKQDYTSLIDKSNMFFKVTPNMIILFRENDTCEWQGNLENVMVEPIEEVEPVISTFLIIPKSANKKYKKERVKLMYANTEIKEQGAKNGDEVIINPMGGVKFWIEGKEYWWMRNCDIFAVAL